MDFCANETRRQKPRVSSNNLPQADYLEAHPCASARTPLRSSRRGATRHQRTNRLRPFFLIFCGLLQRASIARCMAVAGLLRAARRALRRLLLPPAPSLSPRASLSAHLQLLL